MNRKIYGFSNELRATEDNNKLMLQGRAIVFGEPAVLYEIDGIKYKEIITSTALNNTDISDVVLRYNHADAFTVLARTRNKSLQLEKRADGLYIKAKLQDDIQDHRSLYNAVKSGLIDKMSFGFVVAPGGDNYDSKTHTRTITDIKKIYDVSIVDQPAYENTYIEARSRLEPYMQDDIKEYRQILKIKTNIIRARCLINE